MTAHDMPDELCGCDACIAEDVALLASIRDPLARVSAMLSPLTLPPGWTIRHNPIGYAGTDSIVYDADGAWVGCYGHAAVSHRSNGAPARQGRVVVGCAQAAGPVRTVTARHRAARREPYGV